jgi:acyl dehydratase
MQTRPADPVHTAATADARAPATPAASPAPATPASAGAPHAATPRTIRWYWEDFPVGSVREFGGVTLTHDEIVEFARRYDPQPFHLDEAAARESLFGGLCASGWQTCALAMRMMCDAYLNESASLGSPGVDKLRWTAPVYPGDTLHVRMTVIASRPMASKPEVGLMQSHWDVMNQDGRTVLTMEGWGMMRRRHAALPAVPAAPAVDSPG